MILSNPFPEQFFCLKEKKITENAANALMGFAFASQSKLSRSTQNPFPFTELPLEFNSTSRLRDQLRADIRQSDPWSRNNPSTLLRNVSDGDRNEITKSTNNFFHFNFNNFTTNLKLVECCLIVTTEFCDSNSFNLFSKNLLTIVY